MLETAEFPIYRYKRRNLITQSDGYRFIFFCSISGRSPIKTRGAKLP